MSRLIVGDIHGSYDRLMTALDLCKFSDSDTLYCTGDIGDRGPKVRECIDFLMSLGDRFKPVLGNHDVWAYEYLTDTLNRHSSDIWEYNGGLYTKTVLFSMDNKEEVAAWYGLFSYIIEEEDFRLVHTLTYTDHLNKSSIPISEIRMNNIKESGVLDNTYGYDRELFDRHILLRSKYFSERPLAKAKGFFQSIATLTFYFAGYSTNHSIEKIYFRILHRHDFGWFPS